MLPGSVDTEPGNCHTGAMTTTEQHKTTVTVTGWTCTCGAGKATGYKNRRTSLLAARKHVAISTKEN